MKHRIALIVVVLAALVGLVFVVRRPAETRRADELDGTPTASAVLEEAAELQFSDGAVGEVARTDSPAPSTLEAAALVLEGSIVFLDADEFPRPSSRGTVTWQLESSGGTVTEQKVRIRDDRWTLEIQRGQRVKAIEALWGAEDWSQYATIDGDWMTAEEAQANALTARLLYGCSLRVVDVRTGLELSDIELALARKEFEADTRYPPAGFETRTTRHALSPVALPFRPGIVAGWCRAPGYAWQRFAFTGDRGVHTVALSAGCELSVEVRDLPADALRATAMIYAIESGELSELDLRLPLARRELDSDGRAHLSGLPAGPVLLVVGTPNPRPASKRLAERTLELVAGGALKEIIDLGSAQDSLGALRIEVRLPEGRISNMTRVVVQRVGMERVLPVEHLIANRFDASQRATIELPGLSPGDYLVWLLPQCCVARANVVPGETQDVTLAQSKSTSITVRLTHAGKPIYGGAASVLIGPAQLRHSGAYTEMAEGRARGEYSAALAPGLYVVVAHVPGLGAQSATVTLSDEPAQVDVELERPRNYVLRASARHGAEDLLLPEAYWASVSVVDARTGASPVGVMRKILAEQAGFLSSMDASAAEFTFQAPGDYTLVLPKPSGMRAVEPVTITLAAEGVQEVPIHFEYE